MSSLIVWSCQPIIIMYFIGNLEFRYTSHTFPYMAHEYGHIIHKSELSGNVFKLTACRSSLKYIRDLF